MRVGQPRPTSDIDRSSGFVSSEPVERESTSRYSAARRHGNGEWSLDGEWEVAREYVAPAESGALNLAFNAKHVHLVIEPISEGATIEVRVDGEVAGDTPDVEKGTLVADSSRLYQLVGLEEPGDHVLNLRVQCRMRLFAFTFG